MNTTQTFTFGFEDDLNTVVSSHDYEDGTDLDDLLTQFHQFLLGCGYQLPEASSLQVVGPEETIVPSTHDDDQNY